MIELEEQQLLDDCSVYLESKILCEGLQEWRRKLELATTSGSNN